MVRKFACIALLLVLPATGFAAPACNGDVCAPAPASKPLDIKQFMREQAASTRGAGTRSTTTRAAKPRPVIARASKPKMPAPRAASARAKPAPLVAETSTAFAPQENRQDNRPAPSPFPALRAAAPGGSPFDQNVQMVAEGELNDIDRRADQGALPAAVSSYADAGSSQGSVNIAPVAESPLIRPAEPQPSLLQRAWSGVTGTFVALSTAVHKLTGL